jgi:hypothetical protein
MVDRWPRGTLLNVRPFRPTQRRARTTVLKDARGQNSNRPTTENRVHMVALYTVWYNFCRTHKAHKMSPAMAAGVTDTLRDVEWIAGLIEAAAPKPGPRGPYKKGA